MQSKARTKLPISRLALLMVALGTAHAETLWTLQPIPAGDPRTDGPYTIGNTFTVGSAPLVVTQLGALDTLNVAPWFGSNGFIGATCDVGIWNSAGTLLGSVAVASGDPISGNYRYHALSAPITLAAGQSYTIGALCASGREYRIDTLATSPTMGTPDSSITVTGAVFNAGAALARPTSSAGTGANSVSSLRWMQANAIFTPATTVTSTSYWDPGGDAAGLGGAGSWDTSSSFWTADATGASGSGMYANIDGIQAAFGGTAGTVTVASGSTINVNTLRFDTTGYTIAGADVTATLGSPVLSVITGTGNTATINAVISGATSLQKNNDNGSLTLGGVNTYTGSTTIKGGTLTLGGAGQLGSGTYAGALANSGAFVFASSAAQTFSGTVSGTGTLTQSGGGLLTLTGAGKSYSGATTVSAGTLVLSNVGNTFNSSTDVASGAVLELNSTNTTVDTMLPGGTASAIQITGTGTINKTGTGWVQGTKDTFKNFNGTININEGIFGSGFASGLIGTAGSTMTVNVAGAGAWFDLRGAGVNAAKIDKLTGTGFVGTTHSVNSTLTVGTANGSSTYDGIIKGAGGGAATTSLDAAVVSLVKEGSGDFTLTGANTYKGSTTISGGSLILSGAAALASPTITVAGGARFDVSGLAAPFDLAIGGTFSAGRTSSFSEDVKGNLSNSGAAIHIAGTGATAGTLTHTGNLKLDTGSVKFDLGATNAVGGGVNDHIAVSGNLDLTGAIGLTDINVNKLAANLASGTYTLITCGGTLTGSAANLNLVGLSATPRQSFALNTTANSVVLVVTGVPGNLVWTGAHSTNPTFWDIDGTANWSGIANGKFLDGDNVLFNDTASSTTVELQTFVEPSSVTFNNTTAKPYTLTGASGGIDGDTGLVKNGNGPVTITTDNAYTGPTTITAGSLTLSDVGLLGSGNYAGNIANDGALNFNSTPDQTLSGVISGSGSLTMGGAGKLMLPTVNTYSGDTTLTTGTIEIGPAGGGTGSYLGTGNVIFNGGTLRTPGATIANTVIANPIVVNAATTSTLDPSGPNINLMGNITGSGTLVKATGGHAVFFKGDNSGFSGAVSADNIQLTTATAGSAAAAWTSTGSIGLLSNLPADGTIHFGSLSGASGSFLGTHNATGTTTFSIGALNTDTTFAGVIGNVFAGGSSLTAITKIGSGTLTLAGANTYTGITTVSGGTLDVTGSLRLKPVANGEVNTIGGTATLALNGTLNLDLTTAATTAGNSWLLVDTANLSESYGSGFAVTSTAGAFTETTPGVWTLSAGANAWTFTESDGKLTVGAGSGYQSWIDTFTSLTGDDKLPGADPDGDGTSNLDEFAFKGDPTTGSTRGLTAVNAIDSNGNTTRELVLTVAVRTGATFVGSPSPTATIDGVTYTIQGSLNLGDFTASVTETTALTPAQSGLPDITGSGWTYRSFALDGSEGLSSKGFLRAKAAAVTP